MTRSLALLDQSPVGPAGPGAAVRASIERARRAEDAGLHRIWYAEHHRHAAFAGTSPLTHAAAALATTRTLRVGSGGVLAGFHDPERVSDAFTTLEHLFPGRVDAGLGRAGAPPREFARRVGTIVARLAGDGPPVWLLGVGPASASLADVMRTGYAFGHFFDPRDPSSAFEGRLAGLPNLVAARVVVRDTDLDAQVAARQFAVWRTRRDLGVDESLPGAMTRWDDLPAEVAERNLRAIVWGTPCRVAERLHELATASGTDEVMISIPEPDPAEHGRILERVAAAFLR